MTAQNPKILTFNNGTAENGKIRQPKTVSESGEAGDRSAFCGYRFSDCRM